MRRRILEWTLWLSITAFLGVISLEAASFLVPRSESFIAVGSRFFALLRPGWIDLASGLDSNPGYPAPMVVNPRNIIAPKLTRSGSIDLPGFYSHLLPLRKKLCGLVVQRSRSSCRSCCRCS